MKKRVKGLICLWLVIIMALGALPLTASAAGTGYVRLIRDVDPANGHSYSFFNDNGSSSFGIELDVALNTQQALQDELAKEAAEGYVFDGWKLWEGIGSGGVIDTSHPPIGIDADGVVTETAYMDIESRGDQALLEALWVQKYKMDPQPTSLDPTVGVMQADGTGWMDVTTRSDISYQWYPYSEKTYRVVTSAVGADEMEADAIYGDTRYSDTLGAWENPVTAEIDIAFGVQAGDRVIVTASNASTTAVISTYGEADDYARDGAVYSKTMTADSTHYNIYIRGYAQGESFVISVLRSELGAPLTGETSNTLATRATGRYICRATVGNETTLTSDPVSITAPTGYTIVWKNADGKVLQSGEVAYGTVPQYQGEEPQKAAPEGYVYLFSGWDSEIVPVTGNKTYTATYTTGKLGYLVIFTDENGNELQRGVVGHGEMPQYLGALPTKADEGVYSYTFAGWSPVIEAVTKPQTYVATYEKTNNAYTVTFINADGSKLQSESLALGVMPEYRGAVPTKAADAEFTYTFAGWDSPIETVTGDKTYQATYTKTTNQYTVTFKNEDGKVLATEKLAYGVMPAYRGATPAKAADAQYTYTFAAWSPAIGTVTGDATYTATYTRTDHKYTVTFKNEDGKVLATEQLAYGVMPEYQGETPTKANDADNSYTFAGWTPKLEAVTEDVTYTATYASEAIVANSYLVTFESNGGSKVESVQVSAGDKLTEPEDPERKGHSFKGWFRDEALTEEYDFESEVNESFTLYAKWQSSFNVWILLAILALVLLLALLLVWLLLRRRNQKKKDEPTDQNA